VKRSTSVLAALALTALALPLAAQVNDTYIIPAAANAPGAYSSRWMTQLSIFNPQTYTLKVSVTYLPAGGGRSLEALLTVPANSVAYTDNSLLEIFQISGTGGYMVATFPEDNPGVTNDMISRSFLVTTNTVNVRSDGGTYGQTIPGVWTGLQSDGITAASHGVRNLDQYGWRTNFGAVNLGSTAVTLRVSVYDADGFTLMKNAAYTVPSQGQLQWPLPVQVDHGSVEFSVEDPTNSAVVFPYTSTLDRYTGDPTYQSPTLLASAGLLYGKKAVVQSELGRKIGTEDARAIRANADRIGEVQLKHE
jgi:hypothetical protein